MEKHFKVFACCILVKGAKRSTICDVQRNSVKLIPNDLYDLVMKHEGKTLTQIKEAYAEEFHEIVDEYIQFMVDNEYGFFTEYPELFPKLDLSWDSPFEITNAIVDVAEDSDQPFEKIVQELNNLGCQSLQVRYFFPKQLEEIHDELACYLDNTRLKNLEILLAYQEEWHSEEQIRTFLRKNLRVNSLIFHSAPNSYKIELKMAFVALTTEKIASESHCGVVNHDYFLSNISLFTEGINHNNCLNKKISVDAQGNIKNCPSMTHSFGHIKQDTFRKALGQESFKSLWNITKDQVETCKDCEFRYVCTDCRAYVEKDIYSKPAKCTYDPYTYTWH
ncbi:MAG: grasp-with-spasm system SPASM domain peptide maturase [Bacteroidota bacterium]